jgi:uncharacterized protein (DUF983 family)
MLKALECSRREIGEGKVFGALTRDYLADRICGHGRGQDTNLGVAPLVVVVVAAAVTVVVVTILTERLPLVGEVIINFCG